MRTLLSVLIIATNVYQWMIIIRVLLTWFPRVSPYNPVVRFLRAAVDPFLARFRRLLPTLAGVDFSPLVAILVVVEVGRVLSIIEVDYVIPHASPGFRDPGFLLQLAAHDIVVTLILDIVMALAIITLLRVLVVFFKADPWHPFSQVVRRMSDPLVTPFNQLVGHRREFAPLAAFATCVGLFFLVQALFSAVWRVS